MTTHPTKLVLRVEQITDGLVIVDPPVLGGSAMYRLVDSQMSICARHVSELCAYLPNLEARVVLTLDQIESLVVEFGLRRGDLLANHGPWDPVFGVEKCRMCETAPVEGNKCHRDDCARPLHPQWPAVYCTMTCSNYDR